MQPLPLSHNAIEKQKHDLLSVVDELPPFERYLFYYHALMVWLVRMANKLPQRQRFALLLLFTLAGGMAIIAAFQTQSWIVVLVTGILIGILISIAARVL